MTNRRRSVRALPHFTEQQHTHLQQLGLFHAQIVELDRTIPLLRVMLSPRATLIDVRRRLRSFAKPLTQTRRALDLLMKSKELDAVEARNRLIAADEAPAAVLMAGEFLKRTHDAIEQAMVVIARAGEELPREQRRAAAFPLHAPVERIERALLDGFLKHHNANYPRSAGKALPPYTLRNSSDTFRVSRSGPFAEIVRICYEAVGVDRDPDRSIRTYLDLSVARRRTTVGPGLPHEVMSRRKRGRPKKWTRAPSAK